MGRFYKATPAQFIDDKMFELDHTAMLQANETVSGDIDEVYEGMDEATVKTEQLSVDNEEMRQYVEGINSEVNGVAQAMDRSALNYKKQGPKMRRITRGIKNDIDNGIVKRAKENKDSSGKYEGEIDANKDIDSKGKSTYKDYSAWKYAKAKGLNYDRKTGKFNDYEDFKEEVVGGIGDQSKSIKSVIEAVKSDSTGQEGKVGEVTLSDGTIVMKRTSTSKALITGERLRAAGELELKDKNFVESQTRQYEMEIEMGNLEQEVKEDGTLKTAEEYALDDKKNYLDTLVEVGEREIGNVNKSLSALPGGGGGYSSNSGGDVGDIITDTTTTGLSPSSNFAKTRYTTLDAAFNVAGPKATALQNLGFSSSEDIKDLAISTNFSRATSSKVLEALIVIDPSLQGESKIVQNKKVKEYIEHSLNRETLVSPVSSIDKPVEDMTTAEKKQATAESSQAVAMLKGYPTDQNALIAIATNSDGSRVTLSATSIGDLTSDMGKGGDVYYQMGTSTTTQPKVAANGAYYQNGVPITANGYKKYDGKVLPKGTPVPLKYLGSFTLDTEKVSVEETFSGKDIINPTKENFKKEVTWEASAGGGLQKIVKYVYRQTLVKSSATQVAAGKQSSTESVTLTLYFDPSKFQFK